MLFTWKGCRLQISLGLVTCYCYAVTYFSDYRRGLDWRLDLLTTLTHYLWLIAPSPISTLYFIVTPHIPPKRLLTFSHLHSVIFQETELFITTAVRTSYKGNHVEVWLTHVLFCSVECLFLNINIFQDGAPCVLEKPASSISISELHSRCFETEVKAWVGPKYTQKMKVAGSSETLELMGRGLT
jgi:hypothetical protein